MNMYSKIRKMVALFIFIAIFLSNSHFMLLKNDTEQNKEQYLLTEEKQTPHRSGYWKLGSIIIDGDATGVDAHNWTWFEDQDWYGGGQGNWTHPYIIENISIDGEGKNAFTIKDSSVYFIIRNCTFENSTGTGYALTLENVNNGTVTNCSISNSGTGIYLTNSNNNTIVNNTISSITLNEAIRVWSNSDLNNITNNYISYIDNSNGIRINTDCDNNTLTNNFISYCSQDGIYLYLNNYNTIVQNIIFENYDGIHLQFRGKHRIKSNIIFNNTHHGIEVEESDNNIFWDNLVNNNILHGIYFDHSENCTLTHNQFNGNGIFFVPSSMKELTSHNITKSNTVNDRVLYYYTNQSNLMQNDFSNAGQVLLVNCNDSIIIGQNVSKNSMGIVLYYSRNITIKENDIFSIYYYGIYLFHSTNCSVINNTGGDTYYSSIYLVDSHNNSVRDNKILDNENYGIHIKNSNNCSLSHNNVTMCGENGIYLQESNNNTLYNNTSSKNEKIGIYLTKWTIKCNYNKLIENTLEKNGYYGINLDNCINTTIIKNEISNNYNIRISIFNGYGNQIKNNTISNNTIEGIYVYNSPKTTLTNNNFTNNNMFFFGSYYELTSNSIDNSNIINNKILYCYINRTALNPLDFTDAGAIILINTNKTTIEKQSFSNTTTGISLYYSNNNTIKNNTLYNQLIGIYLRDSNFNEIEGNLIYKNNRGINIIYSLNCSISKNNISWNYEQGIVASQNDFINIYLNNISNNQEYGIDNSGGDGFNITRNYITNNAIGIYFDSNSDDSVSYSNSFINNTYHAEDEGSNNNWNYDGVGNFWDNYTGKDENDDGIGDSTYNVPGSALSTDNFPIWWDAPVINITLPILNKEFGVNPPTYSVNILEGVNDTIWYTILGTGLNIYITESTGEIKDDLWELAPNGALTLRFYSNDSKGYIGYDDIIIFKNVETTSDGETNDSSPSDEFDPTPLIFLLILIAGVAVFGILMIRSRSKKEIEAKEAEIKSLKEQREEITEGDILISKEQHICLVHKGTIKGMSYICPDCGAYYCVKCYNALKDAENECWSCGAPLDEEKAKKKSALRKKKELVKEREEDSEIFETIEEVDTTHKSPQKSQKDIPREDSSDDTTPSAPEKQIEKEKLTIKAQSIQKEEKQIKKLKEPDIPAIDKKGTAIKKFEECIHKMKKMANDLEDKITNDEITQEEYIQKRTVLAEKMGEATAKLEKLKESESN